MKTIASDRRLVPLVTGISIGFCALAAPAAGELAWREAGLTFSAAGWDIGSRAGASQVSTALNGELGIGERWEARLELAGARTSRDAASIAWRPSPMVLVRYRPSMSWLVQVGARAPSRSGTLDALTRAVGVQAGEPALVYPEPDPVRGWQLHAGVVRGLTLTRVLRMALAAGLDVTCPFEVEPGAALDRADRATVAAALSWSQGEYRAALRAHLAREGREEIEEADIRSARTLGAVEADARLALDPVACEVRAGVAGSGSISLPDQACWGVWEDAGPARLAQVAVSFGPLGHMRTLGAVVRPSLTLAWLHISPRGLPLAGGWTLRIMPGIAVERGSLALVAQAGWARAQLRADEPAGGDGTQSANGWSTRLGVRWSAGGAFTAGERNGG